MSKIIVPLHFAKLTTTPGNVATGFKKFYLKGEWFKLFNGASEIDVVLDRPLDNYLPIPGIITASDTVLSAIEKLDYALNNFTPTVLWGNIGGALSAQTDLMTYLSGNFYPLSTNPAGYLTLATLPPSTIPNLQDVTDVGSVTTNVINALGFASNDGFGGSFSLSGAYFDMYDSSGAYFTNFGSASSLFLADVFGKSFSVNANIIDLVDSLNTNINISSSGMVLYDNILNNAWTLNYPAKPNGYVGTFAMLDDVPADQDLQSVTNLGNETTNTLVSKDTVLGPSYRSILSKDGLYILQGSNFTRLYNGVNYYDSKLEFNSGSGIQVTLSPENVSMGRVTHFKLPNKPTGTYLLATVNDLSLTEFTFDSYTGVRLKPTNVLGNGFYFERNANESVGYSAVNTNTGNGAVALTGVGIDTNPYIKNISLVKFGPNYYVPLLAGKGGIIATEEVFLGSRDGNDVSILTGNDITTLSRKFTVKANGQLEIQTTPTTGTTSDKLLVRDVSGNVKQIDYPTGGGIPHAIASGTDTYTATITGVVAYNDSDAYLIRFTNGNTTGATLNINGLGAVPLYRNNDGPLLGGDILDGGEMLCIYNSTLVEFQVIGISPNSLIAYVTNADSVTITKGMPVYAFSGIGDRMTVKRAFNTSDATSAQTVGLVLSTSIAANQKGIIMMQGLLDGLSILPTATWSDGDPVYLGATAGTITNVKPYAPNHLVYLGVVTTASNGSAGRLYVRVQNGYELDELHDVDLISNAPTNGQVLTYNATSGLWIPTSPATGFGNNPGLENWYVNYGAGYGGITLYFDTQVRNYGSTLLSNDNQFWTNNTLTTLSFNVSASVIWVGDGSSNELINTLYIFHSALGTLQADSVAMNVNYGLSDSYSTAVSSDVILQPGEYFFIGAINRFNGSAYYGTFIDGRLDIASLFVGEQGPVGPAGPSITIDATVIDGSPNPPSGNAVFDALALKQDKFIQNTSISLLVAGWALVGIYYEYTYTDANITATSFINFTPNNASNLEVTSCKMLPQIDAAAGSCKFYTMFPPQTDIVGNLTIFK